MHRNLFLNRLSGTLMGPWWKTKNCLANFSCNRIFIILPSPHYTNQCPQRSLSRKKILWWFTYRESLCFNCSRTLTFVKYTNTFILPPQTTYIRSKTKMLPYVLTSLFIWLRQSLPTKIPSRIKCFCSLAPPQNQRI